MMQERSSNRNTDEFRCDFCNRHFTREHTLVAHLCEPKRRHLQRDDKAVQIGFMAYQQFWLRSMHRKMPPDYVKFAKSTMYLAFVRFGRRVIELHAINPMGFVEFLLRNQTKIDEWTNPTRYISYVRELTKAEQAVDAIERNFKLMQRWASDTSQDWHEFFYRIEPSLAVLWIISGRISPWILFTASSAHDLFDRLTVEQVNMAEQVIDREFWQIKMKRHEDEVTLIRSMLAENGI